MIRFDGKGLWLKIDEEHGGLVQLGLPEGISVVGHGVQKPCLDVQLHHETWLTHQYSPQLVHHELDDDRIKLKVDLGPVQLIEHYLIHETSIKRWIEVENRSDEELQLTGVRLLVPDAQIGDVSACTFEAPGSAIRPRVPFAMASEQLIEGPFPQEFAPGAPERWGRAIEDSPDVTPGLLCVHNHELRQSLLVWYYSEIEAGRPLVFGDGKLPTVGHQIGLAGWLPPGDSLSGGTQFILLHSGSWQDSLQEYRTFYHSVGILPPIYESPPTWVRNSAIYEVHPGPFGGFTGLSDELPRLEAMGINALYLMPVMTFDNRSGGLWDENWLGSGSPYAMLDFEKFEPTLGTEDEFCDLVDRAHELGLRVLMDFVPQGCALEARYVAEQPEWFCRDELGNLVSSHGWIDTYSLDWANPDYQSYMLGWALRFIEDYNIDGYRIDAPHGKEPNWDRSIPYHASFTSLGVLRLLEDLQKGMKAINPDAAMLCELFGPMFVKSHDFQYDYYPLAMLSALIRRDLTVFELGEWFKDYWWVMPPSAIRVAFLETHDTRDTFQSYAWRGSVVERGLLALLILAGFVPMIWSGQECGHEQFYRGLLKARASSKAVLEGEREFNTVVCSRPEVMSILCTHGDEQVWGVLSLYAERTPLEFELPPSYLKELQGNYRLVDLITGDAWDEYGKTEWDGDEIHTPTLSLTPYVPYFFQLERVMK